MTNDFKLTKKLDHIAFIMDGNGRWAKQRFLPRSLGHKAGVKRIKEIVDECFFTYDIKVVSLYCFSSENWNRPDQEIDYLFNLLKLFFKDNIDEFKQKGVRILVSGNLDDPKIPASLKQVIDDSINQTKDLTSFTFNVLFNYGGKQEIVGATKKLIELIKQDKIKEEDINIDMFSKYLYNDVPPVDLLIRTSGEFRLSNCLLYEIAYAEFIFTKTYWPSFDKKCLKECLEEYQTRNRRFGGLKNE